MTEDKKLVAPDGKQLRRDDKCPQCRAGKDKRVRGTGFGASKEVVCGACGHSFGEEEEE